MSYIIKYDDITGEWVASCTLFPDLIHVHDDPRLALAGLFTLFDAMVEAESAEHGAN